VAGLVGIFVGTWDLPFGVCTAIGFEQIHHGELIAELFFRLSKPVIEGYFPQIFF
jgi:hypothetical protein